MRWLIDGLVFDGTDSRDAQFTIDLDGIKGLYGGVGVRGQAVSRDVAHGDYDLPRFREARILSVSGLILGRSHFDLTMLMQRMSGLLGDGGSSRLSILSEDGSRWCDVRLAQAPNVEQVVPGRVGRYQLFLRAADPRLYGERRSFSGGTVQVHHMGNFPASPVVTVTGPRAAYSVSGPGGRVVQVDQALTSGQTHRIDFRTGRVFRNNALQVGVLGQAGFWAIPPGRSSSMSISSGSMTVTLDDTYM